VGPGLQDHPPHHRHVEPDAGRADVLQAADVPDEGEREGDEECEGGENDDPEVGRILQPSRLGQNGRTKVTHHYEESDSGAGQVPNYPKFHQQLSKVSESVKGQVFKVPPPG